MARVHFRWKAALGVNLLAVSLLGGYLLLIVNGVAQPDVPRKEPVPSPLPQGISEAEICSVDHSGNSCWIEVRNQPGCYVLVEWYRPDRMVRWYGDCSGGFGDGTGKWFDLSRGNLFFFDRLIYESAAEGLLVQGRKEGDWLAQLRDGSVVQRFYRDGLPHGAWITHYANGKTIENRYLLGRSYGYPIVRGPDGVARESNPFLRKRTYEAAVNTDKHGIWRTRDPQEGNREVVQVDYFRLNAWRPGGSDEPFRTTLFPDTGLTGNYVLRLAAGTEAEGPIVDGRMQGEWTFRSLDGVVTRGLYVNNSRSGDWTETRPNGTVAKGPYRGALKHGKWEYRYANGRVRAGAYSYNKRMGHWVTKFSNGTVAEGPYHNRKRHGVWVYRYPSGTVWKGSYVEGQKHGEWTRTLQNGTVIEGMFAFGEEYGNWTVTHADGSTGNQ